MNNRWLRSSFVYLLIIVAVIAVFYAIVPARGGTTEISINEVIGLARDNRVEAILVDGDLLEIKAKDGAEFKSRKEPGTSVYEMLLEAGVDSGVNVEVQGSSGLSSIFGLLLNFLPMLLFIGILLFMLRQAQGSNNQTLGFGRSRARMFTGDRPTVTFADVVISSPKRLPFTYIFLFVPL